MSRAAGPAAALGPGAAAGVKRAARRQVDQFGRQPGMGRGAPVVHAWR